MFFKKLSPLTHKELVYGLKSLGFSLNRTKGSHEQWVKVSGGGKWVVTVDGHHSPFSRDLIKSMAKQAGVKAKNFHALCKGVVRASEILTEELGK
ncbi:MULTISPECIES: type II toxin-antitoxin system HicA family toxin [Proteus]|uniref:type II toxin-antitoxin system HicA family toxin n=1 Tax=Proteus TaxID=583 RepID=UPI001377E741|nr:MULTISPECIES: type II toxin-antitoxin system HicA family toxin [unclassified Proteus (in: enterobacteria)]NBM87771.1 addiction module toxin, HicA family [Proteus sp. G2661]NBM97329.1 addiction module toxin, HicA family [Proteus sp. G2660]